jgi:hypothetical protein
MSGSCNKASHPEAVATDAEGASIMDIVLVAILDDSFL